MIHGSSLVAPAFCPRTCIKVSFTDATRQAKIALGQASMIKLQAEPITTAAVAARFRFGTFNATADRTYDSPIRSDAADARPYMIPGGAQFIAIAPDIGQTPTSGSPVVINVLLG